MTRLGKDSRKSSGSARTQAEHKPSVPCQPMDDILLGWVAATEPNVTSSPTLQKDPWQGLIYTPAVFGGENWNAD